MTEMVLKETEFDGLQACFLLDNAASTDIRVLQVCVFKTQTVWQMSLVLWQL